MDEKLKQLIEQEMKGSFHFFWDNTNTDPSSKGYGLILGTDKHPDRSSIASVGYGLAAIVIGVERGYITFEEGYHRVLTSLESIFHNIDKSHGFYVHFIRMSTAETMGKDKGRPSEYSTIDTAIFLMGVLAVKEYFKQDVESISDKLLQEADWEYLVKDHDTKPVFRMAFGKERYKTEDGFNKASWDHYAEQLMMYILYAGQKDCDPKLAKKLYDSFHRPTGSYRGKPYVHCFNNALFVHQFSHLFIDFDTYVDESGFSWFNNSIAATLANKQWCNDNPQYNTFKQGYWGLTASHCKRGYCVVGGPPWGNEHVKDHMPKIDGTVAPYASLSSIMFTPKESLEQLQKFALDNKMWGPYGLYDSFNFEEEPWYSNSYIGIDKGPTLLALDNYLHQTVLTLVTNSDYVQRALQRLKFHRKGE
ncbi:glucoamylase family protein [Candidatus Xianfuyuplasma coldseepsis]|uniref:Glycoamylase-like domain-containing protein n=1 Tax=Candidatus Xianfuyuplasma coldseepsis TaxID=2782163 RepID=A0A7L7KQI3_9MOLU|nr:glucoamylase family protein [Xianfuyuplasma coldseepsis]QMS85070.1 hypothetical protein G4Z02_04710 [Xianfuyuplasma coldseepsis]